MQNSTKKNISAGSKIKECALDLDAAVGQDEPRNGSSKPVHNVSGAAADPDGGLEEPGHSSSDGEEEDEEVEGVTAPTTGSPAMTKAQKRNRKRRDRKAKVRQAEADGVTILGMMPRDGLEKERAEVLANLKLRLARLRSISPDSNPAASETEELVDAFEAELQAISAAISDAQHQFVTMAPKPEEKVQPSPQLLDRIRNLMESPERDPQAVKRLQEQLVLCVAWENARKFQEDLEPLRERAQELHKLYEGLKNAAKEMRYRARIVDRLSNISGRTISTELLTSMSVDRMTVDTSLDALNILGPPPTVLRRLERIFSVAVERTSERARPRCYIIWGLPAGVSEAVTFLKQADFSGGLRVPLDKALIPQFIGKSGASIRALEEKFRCIFAAKSDEVVVYGSNTNAAAAVAHISQMKVEHPLGAGSMFSSEVPVSNSSISRAIQVGGLSKTFRDIEQRHSVTIRAYNRGGGDGSHQFGADLSSRTKTAVAGEATGPLIQAQNCQIVVRGRSRPSVDAAAAELRVIVDHLRVERLQAPSVEIVNKLFSRVLATGLGARRSTAATTPSWQQAADTATSGTAPPALSAAERFAVLLESLPQVSFLKNGNAVEIVAPEDVLNKSAKEDIVGRTAALLEQAGYTSTTTPLSSRLSYFFTPEKLALFTATTGAIVRRMRGSTQGSFLLEVTGTEAQKAAAMRMVDDILANECSEAQITFTTGDTASNLTKDRGAALQDLEGRLGVRITLDRRSNSCRIVGAKSAVGLAQVELQQLDTTLAEQAATFETRVIHLPSADVIGRLIGTRGATVSQIKNESQVASIDIRDSDPSVLIRGSPEACDIAERMVRDLLGTRRGLGGTTGAARFASPAVAAPTTTTTIRPTAQVVRGNLNCGRRPGGNKPPGWGESVTGEDGFVGERKTTDVEANSTGRTAAAAWAAPTNAVDASTTGGAPNFLSGDNKGDAFPPLFDGTAEASSWDAMRRPRGARNQAPDRSTPSPSGELGEFPGAGDVAPLSSELDAQAETTQWPQQGDEAPRLDAEEDEEEDRETQPEYSVASPTPSSGADAEIYPTGASRPSPTSAAGTAINSVASKAPLPCDAW